MAMWSYECMAQAKMQPTTVTFNVLISACERGAEWKRALNCYDMLKAIPGLRPDSITFNSLISVCEKGGQWAAAEECFKRMREEGLVPTTVTYNALISCCEKAGRWDTAVSIFDSMRGGPVKPTTITFSALIAALEKGGEWERALKMFEEMPAMGCQPNHITYNSLVSACAAGRQWGPALEVYHRMLHAGVVPDRATFNPLVAVLWSAGQFARAQELLREAIDDGVYGEPFAQAPAAAQEAPRLDPAAGQPGHRGQPLVSLCSILEQASSGLRRPWRGWLPTSPLAAITPCGLRLLRRPSHLRRRLRFIYFSSPRPRSGPPAPSCGADSHFLGRPLLARPWIRRIALAFTSKSRPFTSLCGTLSQIPPSTNLHP
jgi:pentatricopeptide repeat protein